MTIQIEKIREHFLLPSKYLLYLFYSPLHEHRHDDMDIVIHAHRADNAGAGGAGCLQSHS